MKNNIYSTKFLRKLVSIILSWGMLISMILPVTAEDTLSEPNTISEGVEVQETPVTPSPTEEVTVENEITPPAEPVTAEPTAPATTETDVNGKMDEIVEGSEPTATPETVEEEMNSATVMSLNNMTNGQEKKKGCSVRFVVQDRVTNFTGEKNFQELNCGDKFDFGKKEIPSINDKGGKYGINHWLIGNDSTEYNKDQVAAYLTNNAINENLIITAVVEEVIIVKQEAKITFVSADSSLGSLSGTTEFTSEDKLLLSQITVPTPTPNSDSKFICWEVNGVQYQTNRGLANANISVEPGSSLVVKAVFEKNKTTKVIFNKEGNGEYNSKYQTEFIFTKDTSLNSIYSSIPQPTKASLRNFKHWKVTINGTLLNVRFYGTEFPNDTALCTAVGKIKLGDYVVITAVFGDPKDISVNFEIDANKGTTNDTKIFNGKENELFNTLVTKVPTVNAANGYKFIGWKYNGTLYSNAEITNAFGQDMLTSSMTFTAVFEESITLKTTAMKFDTNGKGLLNNQTEVIVTKDLDESKGGITLTNLMEGNSIPNPTGNQGYEFAGWKIVDINELISTEELIQFMNRAVIFPGDSYTATAVFYGEEDYGYVKFIAGVNGRFEGDSNYEVIYKTAIEQGQGINVSTLMAKNKYPKAIGNTNYELINWNIQSSNSNFNQDYATTEEMINELGKLVLTPNMGYIITASFDKKAPNTIETFLKFTVEGNGTVNGQSEVLLTKKVDENSSIFANLFTENGQLVPTTAGTNGEEFIGWRIGQRTGLVNTNTLNANLENIQVNEGGTLVVTAVFKEVKDTSLEFITQGPGSFTGVEPNRLTYTTKVPVNEEVNAKDLLGKPTPEVIADEGARFVGWLFGENTEPKDVYDLNAYLYGKSIQAGEKHTVVAVFEKNSVVVTPTPTPSVSPTPQPSTPTDYTPPVEELVIPVVPVVQAPVAPVVPEVIPEEITPEVNPSPTPEVIVDNETPEVVSRSTWSLINLILMLVTIGASLFYVLKKKEENEEEKTVRNGKLLSVAAALGSALIFFLTQDLFSKMIMVDSWTIAMAAVALIQGAILYFGKKKEAISDKQA
ncbi:MAG: InlB B-repeat-containing protein [Anaerorhabdus sp.]|uniref:InlB B-repeat-containing protein n=1 Tax=Anaerorhabdus sp. TaxID=1872524 RepID=UPI003A84484F